MDPSIFIENALIPFSAGLGATTSTALLKPITDVFSNWFYIKFGSKSEFERKKIELKNENQLDIYKMELKKEQEIGKLQSEVFEQLLNIKPEDLQIPDEHIVALIMEDIDLYLSVEEVRSKFAKLLARSADKSYEDIIHPAFVDVIKNISTEEALFLNSLGSLPFAILDTIDIRSMPDSDGMTHGYSFDKMKEKPLKTFVLKLKEGKHILPNLKNISKDYTSEEEKEFLSSNFFVENETFTPIYFLEKQGVVQRKKISESSTFPQFLIDDYSILIKLLVDNHSATIRIKNYVESAFHAEISISHEIYLLELTPFGSHFKTVVVD